MARCPTLKACDLDIGLGHTAYNRASLLDVYVHAKCHWNWRNVLWMDGHTHRRTNRAKFKVTWQKL